MTLVDLNKIILFLYKWMMNIIAFIFILYVAHQIRVYLIWLIILRLFHLTWMIDFTVPLWLKINKFI